MPATDVHLGITIVTGDLVESVRRKKSIEIKEIVGSNAEIARALPHKERGEGNVTHWGETAMVPGIGDPGVTGVTGGVTIISDVEYTENADDGDKSSIDYKHYPHAS